MFRRVQDFLKAYYNLQDNTTKLFESLTDENLDQAVADGHRTVGEIAWHIVVTIPEMMGRTGLDLNAVDMHVPPPGSAQAIRDGYAAASKELATAVAERWTDELLDELDEMYGQEWPKGVTLSALIGHEAHHRGQLTVLLRQAGAKIHGVYGPSKQQWAQFGMEAPEY